MKHTRTISIGALIVISSLILIGGLILAENTLAANGFAIGRNVIGGGGQGATGGGFILNGTVGEPIASALNVGTSHGLSSGFWWPREFRIYLPLVLRN